jgi:hypothetical protein
MGRIPSRTPQHRDDFVDELRRDRHPRSALMRHGDPVHPHDGAAMPHSMVQPRWWIAKFRVTDMSAPTRECHRPADRRWRFVLVSDATRCHAMPNRNW